MTSEKKGIKDRHNSILEKKREESITTISFLEALKENLGGEIAFKIACEAFAKYMIKIYEKVLESTEEYSQERFDKFRLFYEEYAKKTPYLKIIESTERILCVRYERCPFFEILEENKLEGFGYSFCLSDLAFTAKLLPGVKFSRISEIARGGRYCDNSWEFDSNKLNQ